MKNPASAPALSELETFRSLCERYAELVGQEGFHKSPYRSADLPFFSVLSPAERAQSLADLHHVISIFENQLEEGYALKDTPQLLWRNLRKMGYVFESDVFDKISDTDVVQVFSLDHKMIFWNLHLLGLVSFTIEQMFSTPWWLLGKREPDVSPQLIQITEDIVSGKINHTIYPDVPLHILTEADSDHLLKFRIGIKVISPLRKNGVLSAFLATNSAELI